MVCCRYVLIGVDSGAEYDIEVVILDWRQFLLQYKHCYGILVRFRGVRWITQRRAMM